MTLPGVAAERAAIPVERLIMRRELAGDVVGALAWARERRVLVTGAAGSVGWPLAHALVAARPRSLVLLDHHEHSLFSLERSLVGLDAEGLAYELVDVRDRPRLERALARHQPEAIVHLAAAKHVPYGERFPEGVVEANVLATETLLSLAEAQGAERLVYPSSDKSVAMPSLYGATKRICEGLVQAAARRHGRQWSVCRFVNIVGTRGSVIETFTQQVQQGQPLSVTDPRMTRYWISMDEALWLVAHTGGTADPGSVLMPDCGEAVSVLDTARAIADWYGPGENDAYPIQVMGIRPGERLHEVLLSDNESLGPGPAAGLLRVSTRRPVERLSEASGAAANLRSLLARGAVDQLRAEAMRAAEALQ